MSNCAGGTAPDWIDVVSTLICAAWIIPGGRPLPDVALEVEAGVAAAVSVFFLLNSPPTSLLPKALAAEPSTEPAAEFPAALAAAVPAAEPAEPAAELAAASPAA
jgi:hypothetical protein